ncbi:hypothetical protein HA49_14590 [Tatumella morbirosei]|uniref:Uncharacterized protein n=1 Tax=Tatumella morbirosei TaxID=642227 RepID=A0A095T521_9GAMM|nr:hypothetical protein [Tatumella morbirosei]KGD72021.1 hypothetical protein HA49_14590 [Tatumella morbirosei]
MNNLFLKLFIRPSRFFQILLSRDLSAIASYHDVPETGWRRHAFLNASQVSEEEINRFAGW